MKALLHAEKQTFFGIFVGFSVVRGISCLAIRVHMNLKTE